MCRQNNIKGDVALVPLTLEIFSAELDQKAEANKKPQVLISIFQTTKH